MTTEEIAKLFDARRAGDKYSAYCPVHEADGRGHRQSLSITQGNEGATLVHCHAGCDIKAILATKNLTLKDLFSSNGNGHRGNGHRASSSKKRPSKTYGTFAHVVMGCLRQLEHGAKYIKEWQYPTFHVLRFDLPTPDGEKQRKEFRPVHQVPIGANGKAVWHIGYPKPDTKRPLYRLSEITAATDITLLTIHGGEKAADAAAGIGLLATTNAGGENAVDKTDWADVARFSMLGIVIDNDKTGEQFGHGVAIKAKAVNPDLCVKIIQLPNLPAKGDIVEWIAAGGTHDKFLRIVEATPPVSDEQLTTWQADQKDSGNSKRSAHKDDKENDEEGNVKILADLIQADNHFAQDGGGRLYRYAGGVFQPRGEGYVKAQVKRLCIDLQLTGKWSSRLATEVVEFIRVDAPEVPDRPRADLINVENGMVRVTDGVLLPHSPKYLSVVQLPVRHDTAAACPSIDAFVASTFPADAHALAWEIPGVLMVPATWLQKAILLLGEGSNGKSVWLSLLVRFLGKRNVATIPLHRLEIDKFSTARLVGKLANICADLPSEHLAGTSVFKQLVGGDSLPAEYKFKDSFDVDPFARLVFSANHPPRSTDSSAAFFRRWVVIPFDQTFGPKEQIPRDVLDARLQAAEELSGLFNKALDGLRRVQAQRQFTEPESVQAAWRDFHATTDPLAVWLERWTIDGPDCQVTKQALRTAYNAAVERDGRPAMTLKAFGQAIHKLRPQLQEAQRTVGGKTQWVYIGIGLSGSLDSRDSLDSPIYPSRTRARAEVGGNGDSSAVKNIKGNRVNRVNPVNDCPHDDVEQTPTFDGYINHKCRLCGENLGCRPAEQKA